MRRQFFPAISVALLFLVVAESGIASAHDADVAACAISAWSSDRDPAGLNVRAGPVADAQVIGRLPPPIKAEGYEFAAEVSITGSKDGWFRMDKATVNNYLSDEEPEVVFEGEGWVSGRMLALTLNAGELRGDAAQDAAIVARLIGETAEGQRAGPDAFLVDRLHACRGDWVKVEGSFLGASYSGWTTGTCSNQVTTCP
jgi:hypothetical protein